MKRTWIVALVGFGLVSVGLIARTFSGGRPIDHTRILIDIPFEFRVAETVLPAGEYTLEQNTSRALQIRSSTHERVVMSERLVKRTSHGQARIIFTQDHGNYVLSEVDWPAEGNPARQPKTKFDTHRAL
jgi:hypothetical protein